MNTAVINIVDRFAMSFFNIFALVGLPIVAASLMLGSL